MDYCIENHRKFPETKVDNPILSKFREAREAEQEAEQKEHDDYLQRQKETPDPKSQYETASIGAFLGRFLQEYQETKSTSSGEVEEYKKQETSSSSSSSFFQQQSSIQTISISSKPIAFLIEGFTSCDDEYRFPEIDAAKELAQKNACAFFDTVVSAGVKLFSEAIKRKDERSQKILALKTFSDFKNHAASEQILIEQLIKEPYVFLLKNGIIKEIPSWVISLDANTIGSFEAESFKTYFDNDREKFKAEVQELEKELDLLSGALSQQEFMAYLTAHKDIMTVYGLIGEAHLSMFNSIGKVVSQQDGYAHIQVSADSRLVEIHLFGGMHGELNHYQAMVDYVKTNEQGLVIPEMPKQANLDVSCLQQ